MDRAPRFPVGTPTELSAEWLNDQADRNDRALNLSVEPPLELTRDSFGTQIRYRGEGGFWVRITGGAPDANGYYDGALERWETVTKTFKQVALIKVKVET